MDISFNKLTRRDLDEIMSIEADSQPDAWNRKAFWKILKNPMTRAATIQVDGETLGFTICVAEGLSCRLLNIAIATAWRRKGLGTAALQDVEAFARKKALVEICFEVRESNLAAQMLYKKLGYEAIDIMRGYYGDDDGYRMRKPIYIDT